MTIIYNKSTGNVILTMTEKIDRVCSVVSDIPNGYYVESVKPETGEPVIVPAAATNSERMAALEKQFAAYVTGGTGESGSSAVPFVYGMPVQKNHYYGYAGNVYQWKDNDCAACIWLPDSGIWQWEKV